MVVVDGVEAGKVLIRDPAAGGSTYRMMMKEFQRVWTGNVVCFDERVIEIDSPFRQSVLPSDASRRSR